MRVALAAGLILAVIGGLFLLMNTTATTTAEAGRVGQADGSDQIGGEAELQKIVAVPKGAEADPSRQGRAEVDYFEPPAEPLKYDSAVFEKNDINKSNPASSEVFSAPKYIPPPSGVSPTAPIPPTSNIEMRTSFLGLMFRLFESALK